MKTLKLKGMENKIKLVQKPVIKHELIKAGLRVTERLAKLDLKNQVATIDTLKFFKETRSILNKEFADFESGRKLIKTGCLNPYNEFDDLYKVEITEKYKNANEILKDGISSVEMELKDEKEKNLKVYFIEICQSEDIDFITFDKLNLKIDLSTTEKKYKEQINTFIQKICSDVDLIKMEGFEAEIMAEFKQSLNASESIISVKSRKKREQEEKDRIKAQENLRRSSSLKRIGMDFDEMTKSYAYNSDVYISKEVIENFEKSEFNTKLVELEEKIKADKKAQEDLKKEEPINSGSEPIQTVIKPVISKPEQKTEPLKAPIKEEKKELVTAEFQVEGTFTQLKELGQYMKDNNIKYKNI